MDHADIQSVRNLLTDVAGGAKLTGEGVSIALFAGFDGDGHFLAILNDHLEPVRALSTVGLMENDKGTKIVVAFERGGARHPIIMGRVHERVLPAVAPNFKIDGERIVLHAEREIELRCGDASILLTRAGKILIRGSYVLSRSRGANKIKGAFVDIN